MPFFMANPKATNPSRAMALQKYLLLHSQHDELLRHMQETSYSSSASTSGSSASSSPTRISEEEEDDEEQLFDLNNQIKAILTELLNCASVRCDQSFRSWVQSRLMETEQELKACRKRRGSPRASPRGSLDQLRRY